MCEEIEGLVKKKLFLAFSRRECCILGALSRLDGIPLNPIIRSHSGVAPETSRDTLRASQGTNDDNSQSDPQTDAGVCQSQTTRNFGPDDTYDVKTGVQEELLYRSKMGKRFHEEATYCSSVTSSRKQKKTRSAIQPKIHSENFSATIEPVQIFLALQQFANKRNCAIFNSNVHKNFKLSKSLTTIKPTFDGQSEKFELFE